MRILISDDSAAIRDILSKSLVSWGHEVVVCEDGAQAWDVLQRSDAPKLAILDWEMPGLDGISVCKKMVEKEENKETYLILVTSRDATSDIVQGLEAGADDYITKPFKEEELLARLNVGIRMLDMRSKLVNFERLQTLTVTAGAAAHEINQPLTVVIGNADMLALKLGTVDQIPSQDIMKYAVSISEAGKRISDIVKTMGELKKFVVKPYVKDVYIIDFDASAEASSK